MPPLLPPGRSLRWRLTALCVAAALALAACTGGQGATGTSTPTPPQQSSAAPDASQAPAAETGTATGAADGPAPVSAADNIPDAAAIAAAGQNLPADPAEAASALVDRMFGDDAAQAVAATGELLRRAGLPLGSGAGPMVALPDKYVITNAQIGVELLPALTEQARDGMAFDLDQVQALLTHLGLPPGAFTDEQLIGTLAEWGKGDGDPAESRAAGAAERALAAEHDQLLAPADVPDAATMTALRDSPESLPLDEYQRLVDHTLAVTLDPVQVLLLIAHLGGVVTDAPVIVQLPATADRTPAADDAPHPFRRDAVTGPCSAAQSDFATDPGKINKSLFKKVLINAAEVRWGKDMVATLNKSLTQVDKVEDVLSYLAFTLALQMQVFPVDKSTTHFLHDESPHANDVFFRAHAAVIPLVPREYVDCFALAGLNLPTEKDLKDMKVIWSLPNGRVGLKPAVVGGRQFDVPIPLDSSGDSTVQTTPRRESNPPKEGENRPQATVMQTVKASLDKNYLEAHAADIAMLLFGSVESAGIAIVYKVVVALLKEAGLPSKTIQFPVTYHGSNVYHIFGDAVLSIPFYADIPLKADLYSCTGAEGPWQGSITVAGSAGPVLQLAGKMLGIDASGSGEEVVTANFSLNPRSVQPQTFQFGDKYGLVVQLDEEAVKNGLQTPAGTGQVAERMRRIGWASWTLGGQDVRVLAGMIGGFLSQSLGLPVEAVAGDLRCGGTAVYQNEFD